VLNKAFVQLFFQGREGRQVRSWWRLLQYIGLLFRGIYTVRVWFVRAHCWHVNCACKLHTEGVDGGEQGSSFVLSGITSYYF
jgi:hypothetical protein